MAWVVKQKVESGMKETRVGELEKKGRDGWKEQVRKREIERDRYEEK